MKKILTTVLLIVLGFIQFTGHAQNAASLPDTSQYPYWISMMQDPDANFFQIQRAFNAYWENRAITKGCGWKPFKRWESMMESRVSPDGSMPAPDAVAKAYYDFNANKDSKLSLNGNWVSQGPFDLPGSKGYQGLGRVNAIAFHPVNPDIIYVGAPSGGFWYSTTGGNSWTTTTDNLPTLGVSAIVVDPVNPSVIYIGTGDRDASDAPGLGVMKSTDGGLTWQTSNQGMGNKTVGDLLIDPRNPSVLLAATGSGVYKSIDGGNTWVSKFSGGVKDLAYKPGNPDVVYCNAAGNFMKSADAGETWTRTTSGVASGARGVIAVTAANPEVVYFLLANSSDGFSAMCYSDDSGEHFTVMSSKPNILNWDCGTDESGGQGWYDLAVEADAADPNIVFAGGVNIWKSTDKGKTWQISAHWSGGCGKQTVHADQHVFAVNPLNNRLYCGNDGGVYWTDNRGDLWNEISTGLAISQAYKIGQSATDDEIVVNGYQDNGTSVYENGTWTAISGGDGMECAVDSKDPQYRYTTLYYGTIYRIRGHQNDGRIAGENVNGITESGAWVTPFILDRKNSNAMFVGYKNIWRSRNIKASDNSDVKWEKISKFNSGNMAVLEQSPLNTNIMFASGGTILYRSTNVQDETPAWSNLSKMLPGSGVISDIKTSPFDENTVFLVQDKKVFKSTDLGLTWTDISGTLANIHFNSIACYKNSQEGLYLGTDAGVYYRDKSMSDWIPFNNGLPVAVKATELEIYYDPLSPAGDKIKAGTYGRGLWKSDMYYSAPVADFNVNYKQIPKECVVNFTDLSAGVPSKWLWEFEGGDPATSSLRDPKEVNYYYSGDYKVRLTVSNALGTDSVIREGYIHVSDTTRPIPGFICTPSAFCELDQTVSFTDTSTFCPIAWHWSFQPNTVAFVNGTKSSSQHPSVKFTAPGIYSVSLQALNSNGSRTITRTNYIAAGGMPVPFSENFESTPIEYRGWQIENPDNEITWTVKQIGEGQNANTVMMMNFFKYSAPPGRRDRLISPPLNFSGNGPLFLSFDHAYATRSGLYTDSLIILISEDCGTSWTRIFKAGERGQATLGTAEKTSLPFEPTSPDDWCGGSSWGSQCFVIDLSEYSGKQNIRLAFEAYNRFGNNLYLDNISISSTTATDKLLENSPRLMLFPNPASEMVTITLNRPAGEKRISLYNSQGKKVAEYALPASTAFRQAISVAGLPKGMYVVSLEGDKMNERQKLLIR